MNGDVGAGSGRTECRGGSIRPRMRSWACAGFGHERRDNRTRGRDRGLQWRGPDVRRLRNRKGRVDEEAGRRKGGGHSNRVRSIAKWREDEGERMMER